ncbi:transporter substrate-binding domain-containing protein [Ectopseudomonas mendocina]|uniref:Transporter substrate-binding domain-containing protein n=1 Tax=Ectopseudomonas mendocina TaxID=300 RepID=A0ABZ2RGJ1_ECTME
MYKLIAVCLLAISTSLQAEQSPLRFAVNDSWAMPMLRIENDRAVGGILFDLQQRLAAKVGRRARFVVLPHMRVERALNAGEIDVRCYVNPTWNNIKHKRFVWTRPFMTQRDLLVSTKPSNAQVEDLYKERVGTVLGFNYPRLDSLFKGGQIHREDARTQEQTLLKLVAGRFGYAITNERTFHWFNRQLSPDQQLHIHSVVASVPVSCVVRDEPDVPTARLLRAMDEMALDGEFEEILNAYR